VKRHDLSRVAFLLSAGVLLFLYGTAVGTYGLFPYSLIRAGRDSLMDTAILARSSLGKPVEFLTSAHHRGNGVTRSTEAAAPGLTFLSGFFDGGNEMRLIRLNGEVVHRWPVKFFDIFPNPTHIPEKDAVPKTDWNATIHGTQLLPDGSVVFNFTGLGAAKVDRCGRVLWRIPRLTHHAVSPASDGGFWIPVRQSQKRRYEFLHSSAADETLLHVSADGVVLSEHSVIEAIYQNELFGLIFPRVSGDIVHLNDVEELMPDMAASFPQFKAGDLLVSMRFPSLVLVMEPATLRIKWYQVGPWLGQHDPDFLKNGRIRVFSNNFDGTLDVGSLGGSTIIDVDAQTREITYRFRGSGDTAVYTHDRGMQETLDNGNVLITETRRGRVVEITPDGKIAWEFINRYDDSNVAMMAGAVRYPESYFSVERWDCK